MPPISKAKALDSVLGKLEVFQIPPFVYFSVQEYTRDKLATIKMVQNFFVNKSEFVAVRSSSLLEDSPDNSNAGKFTSVLNVLCSDASQLLSAIDEVKLGLEIDDNVCFDDQILIQTMIRDVSVSGVLFTHELNSGAPYFSINYDDVSGMTDSVTSGEGEFSNKTLFVLRGKENLVRSKRFKTLLTAVKELEAFLGTNRLDVEFAIGRDDVAYLFQVRPITSGQVWSKLMIKQIEEELDSGYCSLQQRLQNEPILMAGSTLLGQMPDWNPAEILGLCPCPLSFSIYEKLITNQIWADARELMGYTRPKNDKLLVNVSGHAFVDVGLSFVSFTPNCLSEKIKAKLVKHWLEQLRSETNLHDKIEFDVAITCYSFDFDDRLDRLVGDALNLNEKREFATHAFTHLRNLLFNRGEHSIDSCLEKIKKLNEFQNKTDYFDSEGNSKHLLKLISDCQQYGTIPFSMLARYGFIARSLVNSLVATSILTENEAEILLHSVRTVATEFVEDVGRVNSNVMSEKAFWKLYGHLRPGSYDVQSPRYDSFPNFFKFDPSETTVAENRQEKTKQLEFSKSRIDTINKFFAQNGFAEWNWEKFYAFVQSAIQGREYGKFIFTRSLSGLLEIIAVTAHCHGLSRGQISHLTIDEFIESFDGKKELSQLAETREKILKNQVRHKIQKNIKLPQVLGDVNGVFVAPFQVSQPNFITNNTVRAGVIFLNAGDNISEFDLNDKIVLIESADPGFDWIFSYNIVGLITKFGGANSHMAIRCAEFSLPAAIGCGQTLFEHLKNAFILELDCYNKLLTKIN
ncbi:PEP/pyruvate-binding domain-containing protein [Alphaproteobacteria bacterium]|nr:PEP/pyruvate-binding domain-containing protein [Alphaproteobacteria bacterium]